jgi:renalase
MKRIAIIGAGLAGLTLARRLDSKAQITLFEKSRGVSGRLATRRLGEFEFDHGAQYFTARSNAFQKFIAPFVTEGLVQTWQPRVLTLEQDKKPRERDWFEPHYVAVPRMNSLCKFLALDLDIHLERSITGVSKNADDLWQLHSADMVIPEAFDWVISTAPISQSITLFGEHLGSSVPGRNIDIEKVHMSPCFSLMLGFGGAIDLPFQAAKVKNSAIDWIMVNSSKPGRSDKPTLVIQSNNAWAQSHFEKDSQWIGDAMMEALEKLQLKSLPTPLVQSVQRWRYARVEQALEQDALLNRQHRLAACGDWCLSGRVEGAFLSAMSLAQQLESSL